MSSVNSDLSCGLIAQQLTSSNWDARRVTDAVKILSVLEEFDPTSYCQDGCNAVKKLYNEIILKVHPDKCPSSDLASLATTMATDAKHILCNDAEMRQFCKSIKPKNVFNALKQNENGSPNLEDLAKKFGIDLKAEIINTWGLSRKDKAMDLATLRVTLGSPGCLFHRPWPPIKLTLEEAFQFVIDWIEKYPADEIVHMPDSYPPYDINSVIMGALNRGVNPQDFHIELKDPVSEIGFTKGYISLFDLVCQTLQAAGYIRDYGRPGAEYVIYR